LSNRGGLKTALDLILMHPEMVDLRKLKGRPRSWRQKVRDRQTGMESRQREKTLYVMKINYRKRLIAEPWSE